MLKQERSENNMTEKNKAKRAEKNNQKPEGTQNGSEGKREEMAARVQQLLPRAPLGISPGRARKALMRRRGFEP